MCHAEAHVARSGMGRLIHTACVPDSVPAPTRATLFSSGHNEAELKALRYA
jgi:hypothetical protein